MDPGKSLAETFRPTVRFAGATLLFLFLLSVLAAPLAAERIEFRDGRILEGKVVGINRQQVTAIIDGRRRQISKFELRRIVYNVPDPEAQEIAASAEQRPLTEAERLRLQQTEGMIELWSGQRFQGVVLRRDGEWLLVEMEKGVMPFRISEVESISVNVTRNGVAVREILRGEQIVGRQQSASDESRLVLQSGQGIAAEKPAYDGLHHIAETELGRLRFENEDLYSGQAAPVARQPQTLSEGDRIQLRLSGGQELSGVLLLKSPQEWIVATALGQMSLKPDDIVYALPADAAPPSLWARTRGALRSLFGGAD